MSSASGRHGPLGSRDGALAHRLHDRTHVFAVPYDRFVFALSHTLFAPCFVVGLALVQALREGYSDFSQTFESEVFFTFAGDRLLNLVTQLIVILRRAQLPVENLVLEPEVDALGV